MIEIQLAYLLFAMEAILVLSGIAVFFYFRSKKTEVKVTVKKVEGGNSFHQGVAAELAKAKAHLEKAILKSAEGKDAEDLIKSLRARVAWLEMESTAANQKQETTKYWEDNFRAVVDMLQRFGLVEVTKVETEQVEVEKEVEVQGDSQQDESVDEASADAALANGDSELSMADILEGKDQADNIKLRRQVAFLEERVANLSKFRDLFFDLKMQVDEMKKANRNLKASLLGMEGDGDHASLDIPRFVEEHDEAERLVDQELNRVETQRRHLHDQLNATEQKHRKELRKVNEEWQNTVARTREREREKSAKEMASLKRLTGDQANQIMELNEELRKLEKDQGQPNYALEKQFKAIEASAKDMETCMNVLEMENDRLQESLDKEIERVQELEAQLQAKQEKLEQAAEVGVVAYSDTELNAEDSEQVAHLQEVVSGLEASMEQMMKKITELVPEADKAKELEDAMGGIEEKNMQLINNNQKLLTNVSSLKQEKSALLKKIEELAEASDELDAGGDEDAAALKQELKAKLEELEATNVEKQIQVEELEARYESLEKEYLSLYDQLNG